MIARRFLNEKRVDFESALFFRHCDCRCPTLHVTPGGLAKWRTKNCQRYVFYLSIVYADDERHFAKPHSYRQCVETLINQQATSCPYLKISLTIGLVCSKSRSRNGCGSMRLSIFQRNFINSNCVSIALPKSFNTTAISISLFSV